MKRPYVICHLCTTIDGKIMVDRWSKLPGGKAGGKLFESTAATFEIGAWLVGTTTMKEFAGHPQALPRVSGNVPPGDFVANASTKNLAIGTDARGELRFQENEVDGDHVVLLITEKCTAAYRNHLREAGVSYLICGRHRVDLHVALRKLADKFILKKLMAQGGGTFNGALLQAGLIDEISQVVIPVVDGGGPEIRGFVDAPGKPPGAAKAALRLIRHTALKGGVHWFRYRVRAAK